MRKKMKVKNMRMEIKRHRQRSQDAGPDRPQQQQQGNQKICFLQQFDNLTSSHRYIIVREMKSNKALVIGVYLIN
jgi:hypothetical protein